MEESLRPSLDCTKSVARRSQGAFRPSRLIVPGWRYGSWGRCRSPPFSMGGYGNIFGVCVDGQNIRARICNARRDTQSATISCKGLQTQLSLSATSLSESRFSPKWTTSPSLEKTVHRAVQQQFCTRWFLLRGACRCVFPQWSEDRAAEVLTRRRPTSGGRCLRSHRSHPPGPNFPRTTNRTGDPAPNAGSEDSSLPTTLLGGCDQSLLLVVCCETW